MKLIFLAALSVAIACPAYADRGISGTGNELINLCTDANAQQMNTDWSYCVEYVSGIADGSFFFAGKAVLAIEPKLSKEELRNQIDKTNNMCLPDDATRNQDALVVTKYLSNHPEELNKPSVVLVQEALSAAWPCTRNNK